jgi:DNA repair exonuclease SbcCD ATPase subunit
MKNITFKTIAIQNFLSFGKEVKIVFRSGISIITGHNHDKDDGNGCGKSGILDAFFFVLYGETLKNLKKEQIVNDIAKKNGKVTLEFDIDNNGTVTSYRIERGIAPSFCKIFVNDTENKTLSTIPATNAYICNLLNTTPTVAKHTLTMGINSSTPFMALKKNERREFIEGILRLEIFKIMNKVAKENYDTIFQDYQVAIKAFEEVSNNLKLYNERKILFENTRKEKITALKTRKDDYLTQIQNLEKTLQPADITTYNNLLQQLKESAIKVQNAENDYNTVNKAFLNSETQQKIYTQQVSVLLEKAKKLQNQFDTFPIMDSEFQTSQDCLAFIQKSKTDVDTFSKTDVNLERDIQDNLKTIKQIQSTGSFCDKCKRPFPENDVQQNEEKIKTLTLANTQKQQEKTLLKQQIIQIQAQIKQAETIQQQILQRQTITIQLNDVSEQKKKLINDITQLKTDLIQFQNEATVKLNLFETAKEEYQKIFVSKTEFQGIIDRNKLTKDLITNHQTSIIHCDKDILKLENDPNEFDTLIQTSEQRQQTLTANITTYKEKIAVYDVVKHLLSDETVKAYIIKKFLTVLNERLAYYLQKMDANCKLIFDEYFDDKIINDKKNECSYDNFSGGERKRIDLACLFAFMDLRRIQGDVRFNLAFFDELLDSALSTNGSEKVFEILKERTQDPYNESAFVVTHKKENMKNSAITNVIFLEKVGGITKYVI